MNWRTCFASPGHGFDPWHYIRSLSTTKSDPPPSTRRETAPKHQPRWGPQTQQDFHMCQVEPSILVPGKLDEATRVSKQVWESALCFLVLLWVPACFSSGGTGAEDPGQCLILSPRHGVPLVLRKANPAQTPFQEVSRLLAAIMGSTTAHGLALTLPQTWTDSFININK